VDTHQKLLSVRTPPGSSSGSKPRNNNFDKIYNAAMHNEPVRVKREPSDLIYGLFHYFNYSINIFKIYFHS
jgi:hypothetical protein